MTPMKKAPPIGRASEQTMKIVHSSRLSFTAKMQQRLSVKASVQVTLYKSLCFIAFCIKFTYFALMARRKYHTEIFKDFQYLKYWIKYFEVGFRTSVGNFYVNMN